MPVILMPGLGPALLWVPGLPLTAWLAFVGIATAGSLVGAITWSTRRRARARS